MHYRVLVLSLMIVLVIVGCSRPTGDEVQPLVPPSQSQQPNPGTSSTQPTPKELDQQGAIEAVISLPEVQEYKDELKVKGYALYVKSSETPSRFVVQVGEDRGSRVTVVDWYVVSKSDGKAMKWDLAKGPVPKD